ncbi:MAG: hypothetical protein ABIP94_04910 [Planctomycetota bacterium]
MTYRDDPLRQPGDPLRQPGDPLRELGDPLRQLGEPLHQPPNPQDLRRAPPANAACAQVRGWLRDFADNDLEPEQCGQLEDHVHRCRACSVELARAEHEVFRLRRAYAAEARGQGVRPGFAARVVQRLVLDETSMLSSEALGEALAASGVGKGRRSDGVGSTNTAGSASGGASSSGSADGAGAASRPKFGWLRLKIWRISPIGVLAATLVLLIGLSLLGVGSMLLAWTSSDAAPERIARLVVKTADAAYGARGRRMISGDGLSELQSLWVNGNGEACLDWQDISPLEQPAATLQVHGAGQLRLQNGAPMLVNGEIGIQTYRSVSIPMADGSRVDLGIGEYVITAELDANPFGDRYLTDSRDPMEHAPEDLRVEIEVLSGEARVVRSLVGSTFVVSAGFVGIYQGVTSMVLRRGGQAAAPYAGGNDPRVRPDQPAVDYGTFAGRVLDRSGLPSVGANVLAAFTSAGVQDLVGFSTAADGSFFTQTNVPCDGKFAILQAFPPGARQDLGMTAPDAYALRRQGSHVELDAPLFLDMSLAFFGSVRDDAGQARPGVRVVPCVVDELFGVVWPLARVDAITNNNGGFRLDRLPVRLPYHQHIVVLLLHPELEPTVVAIPARGSPVAYSTLAPFVAVRLQSVRLEDMGANATLSLWEEIPGLPPAVAAWHRTVTTDAQGHVESAMVGRGRLWWRIGNPVGVALRELQADEGSSQGGAPPGPLGSGQGVIGEAGPVVYRPREAVIPAASRFWELLQTQHYYGLRLAAAYRHKQLLVSAAESAQAQPLRVVDESGKIVVGAQVFAVSPSGPRASVVQRFLGLTSVIGVVSLQALSTSNDDVFIIGPDGSIGRLPRLQRVGSVTVILARTGRVLLHASLRPNLSSQQEVVQIRFERTEPELAGMTPVVVRFASQANDWEVSDVPAGNYRAWIGDTEYPVTVPSGGWVDLQ